MDFFKIWRGLRQPDVWRRINEPRSYYGRLVAVLRWHRKSEAGGYDDGTA